MDGSDTVAPRASQAAAPQTTAPQKDPLTGLYQQDYLFLRLSALLRRQKSGKVVASLALLQLENFYEIRRWVGISEADLLLSDIARLLRQALPKPVLLCRCAHYEFAALFTDEYSVHGPVHIQRVKQALHSATSDSIPPQLELKCAVGTAPLDGSAPSAEVLFARARHQLSLLLLQQRRLSSTGFDRVTDDGADTQQAISQQQLLTILRNKGLALNFQAIVNLDGGCTAHYEVRCNTTEEHLSPGLVFTAAVNNALGEPIDRWVIGKCLQMLQIEEHKKIRLTINLSQNSVVSQAFFHWLHSQLQSHPQLCKRLVFQISELDLLSAQHHMNFLSRALVDLGIKLGISQFGCTTDPFRYLPLLQAHYVKLHAALFVNAHKDHQQQSQLQAITARLHHAGIRVIAGEVEDIALLPTLWSSGIHLIQGFSLHQPGSRPNFRGHQTQTLDYADMRTLSRTN